MNNKYPEMFFKIGTRPIINSKRTKNIGFLEVAIAAIIWGSNGVIVNLLPLSSYTIAYFRVFLTTIGISFGILITKRTDLFRLDYPLKKTIILGALLCFSWSLLFEAFKLLPIAEVVLLNYMAPVFITILASLFLKERVK